MPDMKNYIIFTENGLTKKLSIHEGWFFDEEEAKANVKRSVQPFVEVNLAVPAAKYEWALRQPHRTLVDLYFLCLPRS
jgi:hypothetical protein